MPFLIKTISELDNFSKGPLLNLYNYYCCCCMGWDGSILVIFKRALLKDIAFSCVFLDNILFE